MYFNHVVGVCLDSTGVNQTHTKVNVVGAGEHHRNGKKNDDVVDAMGILNI